jgi:hypothetical protein
MFSLGYAQLLTRCKDLEAKVVAGTEKGVETGEQADEKCNHEPGFIAQGFIPTSALTTLIWSLTHLWRHTGLQYPPRGIRNLANKPPTASE